MVPKEDDSSIIRIQKCSARFGWKVSILYTKENIERKMTGFRKGIPEATMAHGPY